MEKKSPKDLHKETRELVNFIEAVPGYVVLKFYEIEQIPLISLRNRSDIGHCQDSFMYFYNSLAESGKHSIEEKSIDLELYDRICEDIKAKYFMLVGYTTHPDAKRIEELNSDCDGLLYFKYSDITFGVHYFLSDFEADYPFVVSKEYYNSLKVEFEKE
ncbi:MAG: hypothetical protein H7A25_20260 [Leptospiraceae bacterium]|nr:hypothetical protein [Leptospiraceae bacterium]MCP5502240.1 hypothetical protein [Leptospiraceae bacterium]